MMGERSDVPLPHSEYTLHVVMVGTEHPGNLGAVCRSLLNHGFDSLRLFNRSVIQMILKLVIELNMLGEFLMLATSMTHLMRPLQTAHLSSVRLGKEKLARKRRSVISCTLGNLQKE